MTVGNTAMTQKAIVWSRSQLAPGVLALLSLSACGGGGSGDGGGGGATFSSGTTYVAGVYMPASQFKGQCSAQTENLWLRSWTNETYLWYREVPDTNPTNYTAANYFPLLKTAAITSSGRAKDRFHFTYPTTEWVALSQSGTSLSYGVEMSPVSRTVPRDLRVAFIEPNAPATTLAANLTRGAKILTVDGADFVNTPTTDQVNVDKINAGLSPTVAGSQHVFSILDLGATVPRTVTLTATNVVSTPVQNVKILTTPTGKVGYLQFNDHIATATAQLVTAVNTFVNAGGVTDLVLDLRYNGGGQIDIASELAFMIAGPTPTAGQTFERPTFNDKNPNTDAVTGQTIVPIPFYNSLGPGQPLPHLDRTQVFVLTGADTCSASESIINGLRGINIPVIQIGSTTCGKPYAFYPQDNCGTTYFTIQIKGANAAGFGDYPDGFSPQNTAAGTGGVRIPGCSVADDFSKALGDPAEGRLAAALAYRTTSSCPTATGIAPGHVGIMSIQNEADSSNDVVYKFPLRENRFVGAAR